jgi:hypothetical protein
MGSGDTNTPATQTVVQQQDLPQWYQQYLQQLIPAAQSAAATPYQAYGGQRIAPLTQDQQQAQAQIQNLQGDQTANLTSAYGTAAAAADPSIAGSGIAAASPYFGSATDQFGNAANTNVVGAGAGLVGQGARTIGQGAGTIDQGIQQADQGGGLAAAAPFLGAASQSLPQATQANVSPYLNGALQSLANQSNLQLQQQILPAVQGQFISAGQFGSTRQGDVTDQAINNQEQTLQNSQASLLNQGYQNAGQLAESNLGLQGQLGATAGGLENTNIGQLTSAGQGLGSLGQGYGSLGQGLSAAAAQQGQLQLGAGQGLAGVGSSAGQLGLSGAQAQSAADIASAQAQAGISQQAQNMGIQDSAALQAVGQQQQQQGQSNLDTAYQDFQNQVNYPWTQIGNLSNVIHGLPVNTTQNTTSTAPATTSQLAPSPLGQLAGAGTAIAGLSNSGVFAAKGGAITKRRVVKKAKGGRISDKPGRNASYGHIERAGLGFAMGLR